MSERRTAVRRAGSRRQLWSSDRLRNPTTSTVQRHLGAGLRAERLAGPPARGGADSAVAAHEAAVTYSGREDAS